MIAVDGPLVSFRHTFDFESDGATLQSDSTLRFRDRDELLDTLRETGFAVVEMRDALDRPGLEWVFIVGIDRAHIRSFDGPQPDR